MRGVWGLICGDVKSGQSGLVLDFVHFFGKSVEMCPAQRPSQWNLNSHLWDVGWECSKKGNKIPQ